MLAQLPHASFPANNPPDIEVRRRALDPTRSFAVSAPAGSGKTGLLTQRVLTLLAYCDEPEEVLAITFTRKAAGEMQDRILQALWKAAEEPQPEDPHARLTWELAFKVLERDRERNWQLLLSPQRLRVQTIDGLCRAITRQLPLASGLGAQPDTLEDADLAYRQAVRELFALLEQDSPLREDLARLLRHLDNNLSAVENLLVALLAKREQWLQILLLARAEDAREYLERTLLDVITEHLHKLHECLLLHASDVCEIADKAAHNLQQEPAQKNNIASLLGITALPDTDPDAVPHWQAVADLLLTNSGTFRARLTKNEGFPAGKEHAPLKQQFAELVGALQEALDEDQPDAAALLQGARELPTPNYEDGQWQLLDSLTRLLPLLVAQLTLVFKQLGATDYSAISQAALLALGDEDSPSDIALQLDYRIRHILVDEFQDTASPQLQLLQKLTVGWQPDDGRTLFIVGDGMQSCYGFRNANVGLFLDARRQGIGSVELHALDLSVNFRSQASVVEWVNHTFYHAFPPTDDISRGAVKYSPSIAFNSALPDTAVNFYGCKESKDDDDNSNKGGDDDSSGRQQALEREAQTVVRLVQDAQARDPNGNIAILVRTRSHLAHILPALSAAGLSWQATDIDSLASRMAIVDLLSLTRALLNPADRIAWLSLLRAPWCGLDLHDLYHLVNTDLGELSPRLHDNDYPVIWQQLQHHDNIPALSASSHQCLTRLLNILQPAWQARQRKPLRQWLEGIWLALGGPATLLDDNDRDNIDSFFALLEQHQEGSGLRDWQAFSKAVEKLYAAPKTDADPRLQVMTIHKSKGLEFDTVIIPALDRKPRQDDHELLLWQERLDAQGERQLLLGPLAATGETHSQLYSFMRREKELQQRFEATRLLYVGCTRAVKRLHLLACLNVKNETHSKPGASSLLASIWEQVKDQVAPLPFASVTTNITTNITTNTKQPMAPQERPGLQHILRLQPEWQLPALSDVKLLANYRGHEYQDDENLPEAEIRGNRLARHTGTVLHRALQVITEKNLATQLQGEALTHYLQQQTPFWQLHLRQHGWQGQELAQAIEKITHAICLTLVDPRGQWLLNNSHEQSACELVLYRQDQDKLRESIIDRTFIAQSEITSGVIAQGASDKAVRWIVDYKSSEPAAGQTLQGFIAAEVESYRAQLTRYRDCFAALETGEIRLALYFPLLPDQRWAEIESKH
jgi:ATP-dependent exoDNAse (exonuclease V) beta subunit